MELHETDHTFKAYELYCQRCGLAVVDIYQRELRVCTGKCACGGLGFRLLMGTGESVSCHCAAGEHYRKTYGR